MLLGGDMTCSIYTIINSLQNKLAEAVLMGLLVKCKKAHFHRGQYTSNLYRLDFCCCTFCYMFFYFLNIEYREGAEFINSSMLMF